MQTKLLRFLQEKEFQRVGAERTLTSDVRIVSATNRNLKDDIKKGVFREDFFFRINVVTLQIPPLRERKDDIPALAEFFVDRFVRRTGKKILRISSEAMECLVKYDFPGNVRELENIIERAVVLCHGEMIGISDLPFKEPLPPSKGSLKKNLEELESRMVAQALQSCGGHQTNAALQLGISERMLRYKLKKYGLK